MLVAQTVLTSAEKSSCLFFSSGQPGLDRAAAARGVFPAPAGLQTLAVLHLLCVGLTVGLLPLSSTSPRFPAGMEPCSDTAITP